MSNLLDNFSCKPKLTYMNREHAPFRIAEDHRWGLLQMAVNAGDELE
jgi:hypothetical protein